MTAPRERDMMVDAPQRQLAAIMFTDMTGYTAMMHENEQQAFLLRERQRLVLTAIVPAHQGRIIQYFGDGSLCLFSSAREAVKAAIAIQQELSREPKVKLRIGLHSGEISYDQQGVYGDCVNLASRIEALASPGSVFISDKVYDEIKNQNISAVLLGNFQLKNVKRLVGVYALEAEGLEIPSQSLQGVKNDVDKTIAVLPFVNMSADPENEYFSDGIAEEILNALTRVDGVQVTARSSSFSFKGKNEDIRQIGNQLGVSKLLTGSVRKYGKRMRITAQLVNTADGYHVWSETYDSELEDIFQVQDEISLKILNRLKENFSPFQKNDQVVKKPTSNLEAYNYYLKGRYYWNRGNPEYIQKAVGEFQEAIKQDPGFAQPHCILSYVYSFMGSAGMMPAREAYGHAREHALQALTLDPLHPESHLSLASLKFYQEWDFKGAEEHLQKALQLNLNSSLINQFHGWFLIARGQFEEAIEKMKQALMLDPLSLPLVANLADAYSFAKRFDEAIEQYEKALEMDPSFRRAYEGIGMIHFSRGDYQKAVEYLEKYQQLTGNPLKGVSALGVAYAHAGEMEKAQDCLERLKKRQSLEPNSCFHIDFAFMYAGLKDYDRAYEFLEKTYQERVGIACLGMIFCVRYPIYQEFRAEKRFQELMEKMGIG